MPEMGVNEGTRVDGTFSPSCCRRSCIQPRVLAIGPVLNWHSKIDHAQTECFQIDEAAEEPLTTWNPGPQGLRSRKPTFRRRKSEQGCPTQNCTSRKIQPQPTASSNPVLPGEPAFSPSSVCFSPRLPPCLTCLIENPEQYLVPRAPPQPTAFSSQHKTNLYRSRAEFALHNSFHDTSHLFRSVKITPHSKRHPTFLCLRPPLSQSPPIPNTFQFPTQAIGNSSPLTTILTG
jgi:hypothetical protein